jgi:hypothetical protein
MLYVFLNRTVIPAQAGIQTVAQGNVDSRLRGNDTEGSRYHFNYTIPSPEFPLHDSRPEPESSILCTQPKRLPWRGAFI